jgi:hypothetical protein
LFEKEIETKNFFEKTFLKKHFFLQEEFACPRQPAIWDEDFCTGEVCKDVKYF